MAPSAKPRNYTSAATSRLSRIRRALRERDWLGISIELTVVTVGVLLAFQIDQWGQDRRQVREERQFLERLLAEYRRGVGELDLADQPSLKLREEIRAALAARGNAALLEAMSRRPGYGCGAGLLRTTTFNDTGFEELVSSGRINLISDPALRAEVRDLAAEQAASLRQVDNIRNLIAAQRRPLDSHYQFEMDRRGQSQCKLNWPTLVRDPEAVNAIIFAHRLHGFVLDQRQRVRDRSRRLIIRLACKLGQPECRPLN
jgi:hypothetical protein